MGGGYEIGVHGVVRVCVWRLKNLISIYSLPTGILVIHTTDKSVVTFKSWLFV